MYTNYSTALVGTWRISNYWDDGFYLEDSTYTSDGIKCTLGMGISDRYGMEFNAFISSWTVIGNELHLTIRQTSTPLLQIGETLIDNILELSKSKLVIRLKATEKAFENAPIEQYMKLSDTPALDICSTAKRLLSNKLSSGSQAVRLPVTGKEISS